MTAKLWKCVLFALLIATAVVAFVHASITYFVLNSVAEFGANDNGAAFWNSFKITVEGLDFVRGTGVLRDI